MSEIPRPTRRRGERGFEEKKATGLLFKPLYLGTEDEKAKSLREIADEYDLSYGYVRSCLLAAEVPLRARGTNRGPGRVVTASVA